MAKILVVTKDLAEFLMYRPVVELLQKANHRVTVVAEGLSFQKWSDVEVPYLVGVGAGDISPEVFQPDLVLTGLGAPINLGEKFGLDANKLGVKLGFVEDIWGVHRCSKAVPDFVCTLDPFGKALIASHKPYNGRTIHVYVTGSPALDRLSKVKPPNPSDLPMMQVLEKHEKVVLLAGQDESTTPMVEGLVAALDQAWENYILIPRLHPKFLARADLVTLWMNVLAKAKGEVLWVGPRVSTQQLILCADYTVSVYSSALLEAAVLGSLPVSWTSEIGREKMRANLGGLERFPLVDYGCCVGVSSPKEFLAKVPPYNATERYGNIVTACAKHFPDDGKNAERVVAAIEQELR